MSHSPAVSSPLEAIEHGLEEASRSARSLVAGHTMEDLMRRPAPDGWSAAECLVHLTLTSRAYLPIMDSGIATARERGWVGSARYRMDLVGRLLRAALDPSCRMKIKTAAPFAPMSGGPPDLVLPDFLAQQQELVERLHAAEGLALDRIKIESPFNRRVKYNLLSAFEILLTHERRHLRQAEQALEAARKP